MASFDFDEFLADENSTSKQGSKSFLATSISVFYFLIGILTIGGMRSWCNASEVYVCRAFCD